jgi:hypothetical protein
MNPELSTSTIAQRRQLPLDVPFGCQAVPLTDGRVTDHAPVREGARLEKPGIEHPMPSPPTTLSSTYVASSASAASAAWRYASAWISSIRKGRFGQAKSKPGAGMRWCLMSGGMCL